MVSLVMSSLIENSCKPILYLGFANIEKEDNGNNAVAPRMAVLSKKILRFIYFELEIKNALCFINNNIRKICYPYSMPLGKGFFCLCWNSTSLCLFYLTNPHALKKPTYPGDPLMCVFHQLPKLRYRMHCQPAFTPAIIITFSAGKSSPNTDHNSTRQLYCNGSLCLTRININQFYYF